MKWYHTSQIQSIHCPVTTIEELMQLARSFQNVHIYLLIFFITLLLKIICLMRCSGVHYGKINTNYILIIIYCYTDSLSSHMAVAHLRTRCLLNDKKESSPPSKTLVTLKQRLLSHPFSKKYFWLGIGDFGPVERQLL